MYFIDLFWGFLNFYFSILYFFHNDGYDYYSSLCMLISPFGLVLGENSIVFTHIVEAI